MPDTSDVCRAGESLVFTLVCKVLRDFEQQRGGILQQSGSMQNATAFDAEECISTA
jgi:hypothetical protein